MLKSRAHKGLVWCAGVYCKTHICNWCFLPRLVSGLSDRQLTGGSHDLLPPPRPRPPLVWRRLHVPGAFLLHGSTQDKCSPGQERSAHCWQVSLLLSHHFTLPHVLMLQSSPQLGRDGELQMCGLFPDPVKNVNYPATERERKYFAGGTTLPTSRRRWWRQARLAVTPETLILTSSLAKITFSK